MLDKKGRGEVSGSWVFAEEDDETGIGKRVEAHRRGYGMEHCIATWEDVLDDWMVGKGRVSMHVICFSSCAGVCMSGSS